MIDNKQSETLLQRSLLSHLLEVLWRSALLTAGLMLLKYLLRPQTLEFADVWISLVVFAAIVSIAKLLGLLMAAARYRNRPDDNDG